MNSVDERLEPWADAPTKPRVLLHCCCAPCASAAAELLAQVFEVTLFDYNPNVYPAEERDKRLAELRRLGQSYGMSVCAAAGAEAAFLSAVGGLEREKEGGARCDACIKLRLEVAARAAKAGGYDYFTTSLTVGPRKNARRIAQIGETCGEAHGVAYLALDFKKKNGFLRSVRLCEQMGLYRQNYCGCRFSLNEKRARDAKNALAKP